MEHDIVNKPDTTKGFSQKIFTVHPLDKFDIDTLYLHSSHQFLFICTFIYYVPQR